MNWAEEIAELAAKTEPRGGVHVINDSKTPSGRVHVGALRGVLIHDAIFRACKERGVPVEYRFGVDDYDAVDEIPFGEDEHFEKYLGVPLCDTPAPSGSEAPDMAHHFIKEFFDIFKELGVNCSFYHMRDIYRSGQFNDAIERILTRPDMIRDVYKDVSGSVKPDSWIPFQAICEKCGRVGTVLVTDFDGKEVTYSCEPNLVSWATGCGHKGKRSPFDGGGKLPWKLEWIAKWKEFPVTIEGAGKDHSTKGGSRDVSAGVLKNLFNIEPPINCPYEFFLVGGAKMSSSKGIGVSARNMADLLPPETLRYLMLKTLPNRPVNFEPTEKNITKVFNEMDRTHQIAYSDKPVAADAKTMWELCEVKPEGQYFDGNFQLVTTYAQLPHLDAKAEMAKRKGSELTDLEMRHLEQRIKSAKFWVDNLADESEKMILQETLPTKANELTIQQRYFLNSFADELEKLDEAGWEDDNIQTLAFDLCRRTPINQNDAFNAIYCVLLNRTSGPKAGNLLGVLDRNFVLPRFRELSADRAEFIAASLLSVDEYTTFAANKKTKAVSVSATIKSEENVLELTSVDAKEQSYLQRIALDGDGAAQKAAIAEKLGLEIA